MPSIAETMISIIGSEHTTTSAICQQAMNIAMNTPTSITPDCTSILTEFCSEVLRISTSLVMPERISTGLCGIKIVKGHFVDFAGNLPS